MDFATQVTFVPSSVTVAAGAAMPAGTKLGGVYETLTYGMSNAPCNTTVASQFVLFNIALPNNTGAPLSSTNLAYPLADGTVDRFSKWKVGSAPSRSTGRGRCTR